MQKSRSAQWFACVLLFSNCLGFAQGVYGQNASTEGKVFKMSVFSAVRTDPPGASNAVVAYIMAEHGYKTEFVILPGERMEWSLRGGSIDSMQASGLAREIRQRSKKDPFIQAKYPAVSFPVSIYYKKSADWQPSWPPAGDFLQKSRGVSINYNYLQADGFNMTQIRSYPAGLKMVDFNRADFWLEVFDAASLGSLKLRSQDEGYDSQKLFDSPMFLLFNDDERGREFKRIWDTELEILLRNPEKFAEVYMANLPAAYFTRPMNDYRDYIKRTYPEFSNLAY